MVFFNSTKNTASSIAGIKLWFEDFSRLLKEQCRENSVLIGLSILSFLIMCVAMSVLGEGGQRSFIGHMKRAILSISPSILFCFCVCRLFRLCFYERPDYIIKTLGRDIIDVLLDPRRYARMIPMLLISSLAFFAFITLKIFIPEFIPFYGDKLFMEVDKFMHFGKLPTDWLRPLLDMPFIIEWLDFFYKLWYFIMFGFWGWAAWGATDNGWRRQFILSFMLCWMIGGAVLATLLSSVGPCFYGLFVDGVNPYAEYMHGLKTIHSDSQLIAVMTQELLAELHFANDFGVKIGISAMPSLHNTLAVLFAITGYKIHRNLGHILAIYAAIIFIGSVALGWHYAIDGYAGLLLTIMMWKFAGWCLRYQDKLLGINDASKSR